jgi:hypothetical protein
MRATAHHCRSNAGGTAPGQVNRSDHAVLSLFPVGVLLTEPVLPPSPNEPERTHHLSRRTV